MGHSYVYIRGCTDLSVSLRFEHQWQFNLHRVRRNTKFVSHYRNTPMPPFCWYPYYTWLCNTLTPHLKCRQTIELKIVTKITMDLGMCGKAKKQGVPMQYTLTHSIFWTSPFLDTSELHHSMRHGTWIVWIRSEHSNN